MRIRFSICLLVLIFSMTSCSTPLEEQNSANSMADTVVVDGVLDSQPQRIGIKMRKIGGVYEIPCVVNGLQMYFIFDTGASNVCISLTEALFMYKNGYITDDDLGEKSYSKVADGRIVANMQLNLRTIELEGIVLSNVDAIVVASMEAPLLLGQSAIQRIGKIEMVGDSLFITGIPSNDRPQKEEYHFATINLSVVPTITWWDKVKTFFGYEGKINELLEAAQNANMCDLPELAEEYCVKAISLNQKNWKPHAMLGKLEYGRGFYLSAISEYENALQYNKNGDDLILLTGETITLFDCKCGHLRANLQLGHQQETIKEAQHLLLEYPNNPEVIRTLSLAYAVIGNYEQAEFWARKLLEQNEEDGCFCLAYLRAEQGRYTESIEYYQKVLELNPKSCVAIWNMANSYERRANAPRGTAISIDLKLKAARLGYKAAQEWAKERKYDW